MIYPAVRTSIHVENQKCPAIRSAECLSHLNDAVMPIACTITHSAVSDQAMRSFEIIRAGSESFVVK